MIPSQIFIVLYIVGVIFSVFMGSFARKYQLTPQTNKDKRKIANLPMYEWLSSFHVITWKYLLFKIGFIKRDPRYTHSMFKFIDSKAREYNRIDCLFWDMFWPVSFVLFVFKFFVYIVVWTLYMGRLEPFSSEETIHHFRSMFSEKLS